MLKLEYFSVHKRIAVEPSHPKLTLKLLLLIQIEFDQGALFLPSLELWSLNLGKLKFFQFRKAVDVTKSVQRLRVVTIDFFVWDEKSKVGDEASVPPTSQINRYVFYYLERFRLILFLVKIWIWHPDLVIVPVLMKPLLWCYLALLYLSFPEHQKLHIAVFTFLRRIANIWGRENIMDEVRLIIIVGPSITIKSKGVKRFGISFVLIKKQVVLAYLNHVCARRNVWAFESPMNIEISYKHLQHEVVLVIQYGFNILAQTQKLI